MTSRRRVLVTGANGFVGRRLCQELAGKGHLVRCAVRNRDRANDLPGEIVVVGPLGQGTDWSAAVAGVDAVIHLAARVHVMSETADDPLAEFRALNVEATSALAQAAAANAVRRLVYVSSIKVHGESTDRVPFSVRDVPHPSDAYARSKWEAECSLRQIAAATKLDVVVVRPPLVYGPGVGGNFLRLLKLVNKGVPLPFGAVEGLRSMIYNDNLTDALVTCALHPLAAGKTYLVSDGEDISVRDLLHRLAAAMGTPIRLWAVPPSMLRMAGTLTRRSAEVGRLIDSLRVDSSSIRSELGWKPPCPVDKALANTARWFAEMHR